MVQITSFAVARAFVSSQVLALSCVPGRFYCGYYLRSDGEDNAVWTQKIDQALALSGKPRTGTWENDSLFQCREGNVIVWDDYCPDHPAQVGSGKATCNTPQNDFCRNGNFCCS